ncbi:hypothetical protein OYE22_06690 [Streptomyces sp. 71268]|uniref:hypothetical protein n=1 Tax=Streptomyces sp. 71268 TaxID=3002640 RepID=UPI0023F63EA3|nr:hypothetical protein [Streptomyces sp. 71268]WEV24919.1 hypothetical protein OYE22_06690 [Streptomyces sp. 71268]
MRGELVESSVNMPDDGLVRRVKALACTAPLQALEDNKGSLGRVDARPYHMVELALHTIDQVAMAMDFDRGAEHAKVIDQVSHFAAVQVPEQRGHEHRAVAEWVLHKLINIGTLDRGFTWTYGRVDAEGDYSRYDFDFKLLVEHSTSDGQVYLRVTDEAINVLVGALDTDVESAQVAAEYKLEHLITRGRLEDAKLAAEQARYRTVQYGEYLRQYLDATRRDVRTVDWEQQVPTLLEEALEHIEARYRHESAILTNITEHRDGARDARKKQQAAGLVDIVRDCIHRHMQLQTRIQGAGALFREEQDRQQFSGPPQRAAVDVFNQVLVPLLGMPIGAAVVPVADFFRLGVAPAPPAVTSLNTLAARLLTVRTEHSVYAGAVPVPDVRQDADPPRFSEEDQRIARKLIDLAVDETRALSALLSEARAYGSAVERLVLRDAVHAFSPALSETMLRGDSSVLLAVPVAEEIDSPSLAGDELLVSRVRLAAPEGEWDDDGSGDEEFDE